MSKFIGEEGSIILISTETPEDPSEEIDGLEVWDGKDLSEAELEEY